MKLNLKKNHKGTSIEGSFKGNKGSISTTHHLSFQLPRHYFYFLYNYFICIYSICNYSTCNYFIYNYFICVCFDIKVYVFIFHYKIYNF